MRISHILHSAPERESHFRGRKLCAEQRYFHFCLSPADAAGNLKSAGECVPWQIKSLHKHIIFHRHKCHKRAPPISKRAKPPSLRERCPLNRFTQKRTRAACVYVREYIYSHALLRVEGIRTRNSRENSREEFSQNNWRTCWKIKTHPDLGVRCGRKEILSTERKRLSDLSPIFRSHVRRSLICGRSTFMQKGKCEKFSYPISSAWKENCLEWIKRVQSSFTQE